MIQAQLEVLAVRVFNSQDLERSFFLQAVVEVLGQRQIMQLEDEMVEVQAGN